MIYFDNGATTLLKPPEVAEAVKYAINNFGNAGRSFYDTVMAANREIYQTRVDVASLVGLDDPLHVAFTSSATESLNLVISGLIQAEDSVITTLAEHNSVLRPLYLTGCDLDFLKCDESGKILIESFESRIKETTKFLVCTHGSNLTGNITDVAALYSLCRERGITMILDVSQTLGAIPVDISMADIMCFTGHKALLGPQGTGGVIVNGPYDFFVVKTGGAGTNSFERFQPKCMPDIFETGTLNSHGLYGLQKGVQFVSKVGPHHIHAKEMQLHDMFYNGVCGMNGVTIYGDFSGEDRLPIVSLTVEGLTSSELARRLWQDYRIATRAGSHCAPLLHQHFNTVKSGMVRFSFSYFNTEDEVKQGIAALETIVGASSGG